MYKLIYLYLLQYWLCERAEIFEQRKEMEEKTLRAVRRDVHNISKDLLEIKLIHIEEEKVTIKQHYTHYLFTIT